MTDSEGSKTYIDKSGVDILNPHEVMASDKEDFFKIYLLAFIVRNARTQGELTAARRYLHDLIGNAGMLMLVAAILYYKRHCPHLHFPYPSDIADELESLLSDIPEQR